VSHPRNPDELLEIAGDDCGPLSEMILGFASGYFSWARSRIISISASFIDSRRSQCRIDRLYPSKTPTRSFRSGVAAAFSHTLRKFTARSAALFKRATSSVRCTQKYDPSKYVGFHSVAEFFALCKKNRIRVAGLIGSILGGPYCWVTESLKSPRSLSRLRATRQETFL